MVAELLPEVLPGLVAGAIMLGATAYVLEKVEERRRNDLEIIAIYNPMHDRGSEMDEAGNSRDYRKNEDSSRGLFP